MATVNPLMVAAQLLFCAAVCIRQVDAELADFTKQGSLVNSEVVSRSQPVPVVFSQGAED